MAQPHIGVDPWLAGVDVEVRDTGGVPTAAGAGFSLSPGEANAVLAQALSAREKLRQLRWLTDFLKQVSPAAHDPASVAYNARLSNGHGVFDAADTHINAEVAYLDELIEKIREAIRVTGERDAEAAEDVGKAGSPNGGVAG